jgi:5-carboxymethyl-2-hydroxymuconate isomerase
MVATGAVNLKGLKSRAIRLTDYRLADGDEIYAFVHVQMWIRDGRSLETKQEMAQRAMAVLEETFGHRRDDGYLSLSVDIQEMAKGVALTNHNIPAK